MQRNNFGSSYSGQPRLNNVSISLEIATLHEIFTFKVEKTTSFRISTYNRGQNVWDKVPFPELLQYSLAPPYPPDAMLDDSSASLSLRTTLHGGGGRGGGGGEGRIWPKERLFPCEKLIDGRGSAFCKLVPHNFGQDCSSDVTLDTGAFRLIPSCCHQEACLENAYESTAT